MTPCLSLADRLQGIYILPVNDGCGPLDGKMTFERRYSMDAVQVVAGALLERLEAGEPHTGIAVELMIEELSVEKDWAGLGLTPYVAPINIEAIEALKKFIS